MLIIFYFYLLFIENRQFRFFFRIICFKFASLIWIFIILELLKKYKIAFVGLSLGNYQFNFDIDDHFFKCFDNSEITRGNIKLELLMEKSNSMLVLDFNLEGKVELVCDRCSDVYWQSIKSSDRLYIKFGESQYEQTDDIVVIADNETHFDISQYVYEFVHLNLPSRWLHPGGKNRSDNCDPSVLKKLEELTAKTDDKGNPETGATDHWEALRKLKKN